MADDDRRPEDERDARDTSEVRDTSDEVALSSSGGEDDGVKEAVEATHATVSSALDRIRQSREILADSLKPIDELLDDLRVNEAGSGGGGDGDAAASRPRAARRRRQEDDASGPDAAPPA